MVGGISFRGSSLTSAKDILNQPQKYTTPQAPAQQAEVAVPSKKKGGVGKTILKIAAGVAVAAGALAAGKHFGVFDKVINKLGTEGAKGYISKGAEYLNQGGEAIINAGKSVWGKVAGLCGLGK